MIVLMEELEAWSLMMLVSAVAIDNADISEEAKEKIRRWRSDRAEKTPELGELTVDVNSAINSHLDKQFLRRVKNTGWYETVRR